MKIAWVIRMVCVGIMVRLAAGGIPVLGQGVDIPGPVPSVLPSAAPTPSALPVDPSPQEGVLLLLNGEVLQGKIVRVGDFYYVAVPNGQVRIRATDVEIACRTLQEGYQFKRQNIRLPSAQEHLNLGQWCIRHGLVEEAQRELAEAVRLQPDHPLIPLLRRRIEIARQPPLLPPPSTLESPFKGDSGELESWVRSLPPAVVEQFTQSIQPILLNNCTSSGCHGPTEKNRFSLLKPPTGQSSTRRLTQRNLTSTLPWIDLKEPLRSRLLTAPLTAHGSAKTPVFGNPNSPAYQRLVQWVLLVAGGSSGNNALVKGGLPSGGAIPSSAAAEMGMGKDCPLPSLYRTVVPRGQRKPGKEMPSRTPEGEPAEGMAQKGSSGDVIPAVAGEESPQMVQQAGVWQPVPGTPLPPPGLGLGQGPLEQIIGSPAPLVPSGPNQQSNSAFFPSPIRPRFSPPHRSEPKRGDPMAGQFRPADPFDPELFNRRYHPEDPARE